MKSIDYISRFLYFYRLHLCIIFIAVGHGRSDGVRGHVDDAENYSRDVLDHYDQVQKLHPNLPRYIIGHSMVS